MNREVFCLKQNFCGILYYIKNREGAIRVEKREEAFLSIPMSYNIFLKISSLKKNKKSN